MVAVIRAPDEVVVIDRVEVGASTHEVVDGGTCRRGRRDQFGVHVSVGVHHPPARSVGLDTNDARDSADRLEELRGRRTGVHA